MTYNIGDSVWYAACDVVEKSITCPDCCGQKYLTVIFGDGSQVTIDCEACELGYDPPRGVVTYKALVAKPRLITIDRVEISANCVEYGFNTCYRVSPNKLFTSYEDAEKKAAELALEREKSELEQINNKENRNRTWAWNAAYHKKSLKRALADADYHQRKLEAAKQHVKKEGA